MAKNFTSLSDTIAQLVTDFNDLVNKVGDLANLNPDIADSDLVAALNNSLGAAGLDSDAVDNVLITGGYIGFTEADSEGDIILRTTNQAIVGNKTFINNISFGREDDSSEFRLFSDSSGLVLQWADSGDSSAVDLMRFNTDSAIPALISSIDFYTDGTLVGSIESDGHPGDTATILNQGRADTRYLRDSDDVVDQTHLANVVTLIIYDSAGSPVKTLYGAGS